MTARAERRIDAHAVWIAAAVVVLAAYGFVVRPGEARLAERVDEIVRTTAQLRAGERLLAAQPRLEAERGRLASALRRIDAPAETTQLVARFLRDAAGAAARRHAVIVAIAASGATATPPAAPATVAALDLTLEGRYADVLSVVRELSSGRLLATVDVMSIARKSGDSADAAVTAALHVVLERITADRSNNADRSDVRARPR